MHIHYYVLTPDIRRGTVLRNNKTANIRRGTARACALRLWVLVLLVHSHVCRRLYVLPSRIIRVYLSHCVIGTFVINSVVLQRQQGLM